MPSGSTLIVEARDLDTDESIARFDVDMPADDAGQRAQLAGMVARAEQSRQDPLFAV